jgi:branched-chain amino acid transport system ATP-binding protein
MTEAILRTHDLTKSFGALVAVGNVTIDFEPSKIHAIIGPNGAGKTTLINLLSGALPPSRGSITFKGRDVTKLAPFEISQIGIGRSFQKTNIFPEFSCLENCLLGSQSRLPTSMRFFRPAASYPEVRARAKHALELCGLGHRQDVRSAQISHGEQRQLEIAMMLATEPELLLLDEPLAGMGTEEAEAILELLKDLAGDHSLILIEHDMDAVFTIADVLTVMVNGKVLVTGAPDDVRNNAEVLEAYLGTGDDGA